MYRPPDVGNVDGARPNHTAAAMALPWVGGGYANILTVAGDAVWAVDLLHASIWDSMDDKPED